MNEGVTVVDGGFAAHLYDGIGFRNKPDLVAEGLAPARVAYASELWAGQDLSAEMPTEQAVKNIARSVAPGVKLILDIERWNVQKDPSALEHTIDKLLEIVGWVRSANPQVEVGFFGLAPLSNGYREVNYAKTLDNPTLASTSGYANIYHNLQALDVEMARLANAVDFVAPALYTFKALSGPNDEYRQIWDIQAANAIHEAQQYGKPVIPFLWPQFFDRSVSGADNEAVPTDFWLHQLEYVREQGADGAILWSSRTYRSEGWNDLDPWWAATKAFLSGATDGDHLLGDASANLITATTPNDQLSGFAGDDVLTGGAGANRLFGGDGNDVLAGEQGQDILDGGLGQDMLDGGEGLDTASYGSAPAGVVVSLLLKAIPQATAGAGADTLTNIENLTGSNFGDVLTGDANANVLDGGPGADLMVGGGGDDTYVVGSAGDKVTESPGGGIDTVLASINYTLSSNVENLKLTGARSITGVGNALNNVLTGNGADNVLAGNAGNDFLDGGSGLDTASYASAPTSVTVSLLRQGAAQDTGGGGADTLRNIENLTGSSFDDVLTGDGHDNVLDGSYGRDTMAGGLGNDTYVVNSANDKVIENPGEGSDTVKANIKYVLPVGVENLQLIGTGSINATGNALDNALIGNSAANVLDGKTGADTMAGGLGEDTYYVDNVHDVVSEIVGSGNDTVITRVSFVLGAGSEVELLRTYSSSTTTLINLTGNEFSNTLVGNAAANRLNGGGGADTMVGGLGDDIYYVDRADDAVYESADSGRDTVVTSVSYTLSAGSEVEVLRTYGSATTAPLELTGNEFSNTLIGNAAANLLNGGGGADVMAGRLGDDTYIVDNAGDKVVENLGEGSDTVQASLSYILPAVVENLQLTGMGSINATGNALNNVLIGNSGRNVLDGKAGVDTMAGGLGDDTYYVNSARDVVLETVGGGKDTVITDVSFALSAGSEVELLRTYGSSTTTPINLTANEFDNTLIGNVAANVLDGRAGVDIMAGGLGDDTYYVNSAFDVVLETVGGGKDTVITDVSFALSAGSEVELLRTYGSSTTTPINLTANEFDNTLIGNVAANVLDGRAGVDIMAGGLGDDTYYVNSALDVVLETVGGGKDTVITDVSFALSAGSEVELLRTYGSWTTAPIGLTGNGFRNTLVGNTASNVLDGGAGADIMIGEGGDDTYFVDNAGDVVSESAGGGKDTVITSVSFVLRAGSEVELLRTYGSLTSAPINLTGNEFVNTLVGNASANVLNGGGGADVLHGFGGADRFVLAADASSADRFEDFTSSEGDRLALRAADFGLAGGAGITNARLSADWFEIGPSVTKSHGEFLFNPLTNTLSWDADGAGPGAQMTLATFERAFGVAAGDFLHASDFLIT